MKNTITWELKTRFGFTIFSPHTWFHRILQISKISLNFTSWSSIPLHAPLTQHLLSRSGHSTWKSYFSALDSDEILTANNLLSSWFVFFMFCSLVKGLQYQVSDKSFFKLIQICKILLVHLNILDILGLQLRDKLTEPNKHFSLSYRWTSCSPLLSGKN